MKPVQLSNKTYDRTKPAVMIWIPALGTLYFAVSAIWGLPYAEQVLGTLVALETFLGAILGLSSYNHTEDSAGDVVINSEDPDKEYITMELGISLDEMHEREKLVFHVRHEGSQAKQGL